MGEHLINSLLTVATAIVGVAIIAVLVSNKAQTGNVITSAGQAFANDLSAAVAPVTGATATINTGGGGFGLGGFSGGGNPTPSTFY
jgi:PRD1 phage membrane DNA delivery